MINTIEKIIAALRGVSLSANERRNMRLRLEVHMRENPLRQGLMDRILISLQDAGASISKALNAQTFITHPVFAMCALVLCIGLGTSYAAANALPGQALYAFKTRVNEPLQGAFALTPTAKAQWSAELTNRRLHEAEELAATDQLSPVATADIESGLNVAVQNFNSSVTLLSKDDDADAASVQSDLEASLNAHEAVLSSLPTAQKNSASKITSLVRKHADTINQERTVAEAAFTATDSPMVKTAALAKKKKVQNAIDQTQLLSRNAFSTQVASSVNEITNEASRDMNAGDSDAKHGKWGKAYGAFQDAFRKIKETQESIDTRTWLHQSFNVGFSVSATSSTTSTDSEATSSDATGTDASSSSSND